LQGMAQTYTQQEGILGNKNFLTCTKVSDLNTGD
jgi:hypothetical protein